VTVRVVVLCVVLAVSAIALGMLTASNTVPSSSVGQDQATIDANALKPAACTMNLTSVITNGNGTAGNDLILANASGGALHANGGKDCMIGGAGADTFNGNGKNAGDVCIGNGGNDKNQGNKCQFFTQ
jgi:Ca2+-binding RTX toxin-like protein